MYNFDRDPYKSEYIDLGFAYDPGIVAWICHRCYQIFRFRNINEARFHRKENCR